VDASGSSTLVRQYEENALQVIRVTIEEDLFGNQEQTEERLDLRRTASPITAIVADTAGKTLFAGTQDGRLLRWDLRNAEAVPTHDVSATDEGVAIASLGMVFGDVSVAVGDATGGLSTWSLARDPDEASVTVLAKFHELPGHPESILQVKPSYRTKTLLTRDTAGNVHATHMTSEQRLFELGASQPIVHCALATRDNGMLALGANGSLNVWTIDNPHPEVSFRTLFGKVWYERYDDPQYVWQSSASSDDFEPKLSLIPLIFGSFKGTFYAMLLAVPLAIFGAIYTSQFAEKRARGLIKSTVEIMAAVPSVVIGFLAALWFAPIVEHHVLVFLLWFLVLPVVFVAFMFLWQRLRRIPLFKPIQRGYEFLAIIPVILIGVVLAYYLAGGIERVVLGMDFKQWLFEVVGERYDQRNSIIIAFALGFAVIPIIFTITEDALSNVPFALRAASLALAATRWQTVWRVVLPSASPGIFAAIMVGFGRAVGETMIVLMATGNTPILDASIFNGMRTLSANIAVEVPEAPVGGTLYRVLFLSAVLLFVLTSVANTVAELVRHRLRKKYGQF
jgi:phosphate transport system permease protein